MATEAGSGSAQENRELIDLAERSFKTVLDADLHQDNKAARLITGMAFLTAAAAATFAKAYSPNPFSADAEAKISQILRPVVEPSALPSAVESIMRAAGKQPLTFIGMDLAVFFFATYMLLVVLGTMFQLIALGPSLNIPSWFRSKEPQVSLLFFDKIAVLPQESWNEIWKKSLTELQSQILENYIRESRLIAQKARSKVTWMSWGSQLFKLALLALLGLVTDLLSSDPFVVLSAFLFAWSLWVAGIALERRYRPPHESSSWLYFAVVALVLFICSILVIFLRV